MANALGELFGDIASAIREKTGDAEKMKPAKFPEKISEIETGVDVSGVTATAPHVLDGDVFVDADGNPVNGTMKNNGAVLKKLRYSGYDKKHTYTIPEGYHDGTGIVEVECDSEQIVYPSKYRQRLYGTPIRDNDWNLTGYNFLGHVVIDPIPDQYQDVTPVTATAEDVRAGKVFVDAQGNAVEGALSGTIADVSGVTATAADVRQGKVIVDAQGNEVVGTLVVEQKAPDVIWVGKDSVSNALVGTGVIRYVTFCNHDGTETYGQKSVIAGENCVDPVAAGHMETPTRESTAEHNFTFSGGWATEPGGGINADALKNVTEDRTVYANFIAAVRYYTITYLDSDGTTVLKTESLAYGAMPSYSPVKDGYKFNGWSPLLSTVTEDVNYTAKWIESVAFADASWETIAAKSADGTASEMWKVGDTKKITCNGYSMTVVIAGFNVDTLSDGSGTAGITLITTELYPEQKYFSSSTSTTNIGKWSNSYVRSFLSETYSAFDTDLKSVIKEVSKRSYVSSKDGTQTTADRLWCLSANEVNNSIISDGNPAYAMFTNSTSRIRKRRGLAENWLLRDANGSKTSYYVSYSGSVTYGTYSKTTLMGVLFGFCV